MTLLYSDNFDSDTTGALPSGWTAIASTTWTVGTTSPVSGAKSLSCTSNADKSVVLYTALGYGTTDQIVQSSQNFSTSGTRKALYPMARVSDASLTAGYVAVFSGVNYLLFKIVSGVYTQIATAAHGLSLTDGIAVVHELSCIGTTIAARVWLASGTRPSSPTVSATDSTSSAGTAGIFNAGSSGAVGAADDFSFSSVVAATAVTMTGPTTGTVGVASSVFTIGANGTITGTVTVTPSDSSGGGTFSPTSVAISAGTPNSTFTYTAASTGAKTVSVANNGSLSNPSSITYTASAAPAAVTLTSPSAYQIFQRSGTTGTIAISGQHSDTVSRSVEASFNGGSFATIATAIAPGVTFNGTLPAQAQGAGSVVVRLVGNTGVSSTVANVGIGDVFLLAGQSNNVGQGTNPQVYHSANLPSGAFSAAYAWGATTDPLGSTAGQVDSSLPTNASGAGGSVWPLVAGRLASLQKIPIGFVQCSRDGCGLSNTTNVQTWLPIPTSHTDRTKLYGSAVYRAQTVGGVKAVLYWGGESDSIIGRTQAQYSTDLNTLAAAFLADLSVPFMPCALQHYTAVSDANQTLINNATIAAWGTGNIKAGPDLRDIQATSSDNFHIITDDALSTAADRWVTAISVSFYGAPGGTVQGIGIGGLGLTATGQLVALL